MKRKSRTVLRDSKAEELETRGLYRRAAARWAEVMLLVDSDTEREQAAKRRFECIRKVARPPVMADTERGRKPYSYQYGDGKRK